MSCFTGILPIFVQQARFVVVQHGVFERELTGPDIQTLQIADSVLASSLKPLPRDGPHAQILSGGFLCPPSAARRLARRTLAERTQTYNFRIPCQPRSPSLLRLPIAHTPNVTSLLTQARFRVGFVPCNRAVHSMQQHSLRFECLHLSVFIYIYNYLYCI